MQQAGGDEHGGGESGSGECGDGNYPDIPSAQQEAADNSDKSCMLRDPTRGTSQKSPQEAIEDEKAPPASLVTDTLPQHLTGRTAVAVRHSANRKRPGTVFASHIFITNDPLRESTWELRHVLGAQKDDLWSFGDAQKGMDGESEPAAPHPPSKQTL